MTELLRASVFHTPGNTFQSADSLKIFPDGALAVENGTVRACGSYSDVRKEFPEGAVRDLSGCYILPGLVDTHIHFPQVRIIGGLGYGLLDWLEHLTLPEEERFADSVYANTIAHEFVQSLASHGTTTALVFGSHFVEATACLFDAAANSGLRIISGLVLSDRLLSDKLLTTPELAWQGCQKLMAQVKHSPRLSYAVIPRFALSASEPMLEVCQALLKGNPALTFTSHINENQREVEAVATLFPWATDYLDVYERFDLIGKNSVLAHNIHSSDSEIARLAKSGAAVAHCPCSNAALGSGIFPMRRHLELNAHFALGTDVGGGTGFGILKEALQSHLLQRLAPCPITLTAAQMLYLATRAGAEALAMEESIGDFTPGKQADYVVIKPRANSPLANVMKGEPEPERALAALFTLTTVQDILEVHVAGDLVHENH